MAKKAPEHHHRRRDGRRAMDSSRCIGKGMISRAQALEGGAQLSSPWHG